MLAEYTFFVRLYKFNCYIFQIVRLPFLFSKRIQKSTTQTIIGNCSFFICCRIFFLVIKLNKLKNWRIRCFGLKIGDKIGKMKVRVRNGFSDRNNLDPISKLIQLENFTTDSRVVLFNTFKKIRDYCLSKYHLNNDYISKYIKENLFCEIYIDKYEDSYEKIMGQVQDVFLSNPFHEVLTTIEFLSNIYYFNFDDLQINKWDFNYQKEKEKYLNPYKVFNQTFEDEFIGYRFVNKKIIKISDKNEMNSIENACQTPNERVNSSIEKALDFIGENEKKDYKNSIKESLTAVETYCNYFLHTTGLTLGKALNQVTQKTTIHTHP